MISSWLIKIVVGIALLGVAVLELGSPLIAKAQADDAAHEVADDAAFALKGSFTKEALAQSCASTAKIKHVKILRCDVTANSDRVIVTVEKKARSVVLYRFGPTKDWYTVEATAVSSPTT